MNGVCNRGGISMKAIVYTEYGTADALEFMEIDR